MDNSNRFYLAKQKNELQLVQAELEIKHQLSSLISKKDLLEGLLNLPNFLSSGKKNKPATSKTLEKGSDLLQSGIQLYHLVQEITTLTKNISQQFKSNK